jgi:hypothetical protein
MLERIESPEGVLAFRALGKVDRADYEKVLMPAVDEMIRTRHEVRLVYMLGEEFDGYSVGAGWEDTKLGFGHLSKWKRIAVVTDRDWVRHGVEMFSWMVPGDVKVFPVVDQDAAIDWATG